jgi:hypothetical protein
MTIAEIEKAITELSKQDLIRFSEWFDEYYNEMWDKQIEEDVKLGKLDALLAEVDEGYKQLNKPKFGSAKGKIKFAIDFNAPLTDFHE